MRFDESWLSHRTRFITRQSTVFESATPDSYRKRALSGRMPWATEGVT
jgi:hypothetical protein